jgi:hypothetical protein
MSERETAKQNDDGMLKKSLESVPAPNWLTTETSNSGGGGQTQTSQESGGNSNNQGSGK